jgi:peptide/nickel transport system substrate-binding protein
MKIIPAVPALGDAPARNLFNALLNYVDDRETLHPYLAATLPELNTATWTVAPDGRMETTYRLRPQATWQDGAPLSANDFAFAWRVYATPELGHATTVPISEIESVAAPDAATVVIRWRRPFPDADRIGEGLPPLPVHILEESFQRGDLEAFAKHSYWTTQYVSAGPWRADRWEPGAFVEGVAFDGHVLGRPKIDRIRLTFNADPIAVLASVLAGESHVTVPFTMYPEQADVLRQQGWSGTVLWIPGGWRRVDVQHRPDFVNPPALRQPQVRKAFAHAIDRAALNEAVYLNGGIVTDTPIPPSVPYYAELDRAISHYPYDLRRVDGLMAEAGFSKNPDGGYVGPDGDRLSVEIKANGTEAFVKEMAIIAAGWRQAGLDTRETAVPVAQSSNGEVRSSFPAFYSGQGGSGDSQFGSYLSNTIPMPQNNWIGSNRAGFSDAEFDRLYEAFSRSLDRTERNRLAIGLARILTDQVATISLVFTANTEAVAPGLAGPAEWGPSSSFTWNAHLWEWQ